jgi:hypothetical protein
MGCWCFGTGDSSEGGSSRVSVFSPCESMSGEGEGGAVLLAVNSWT